LTNCVICENRRPKRYCPAVRSQICPPCCGTEREESLDCPLDCSYLRESRAHEKRTELGPKQFPFPEIQIGEKFLRENEGLLMACAQAAVTAAFDTPGAVDRDLREALEALARTYKSLASGILYPTRPDSLVAQAVESRMQDLIQSHRQARAERTGVSTRDADLLGVFVFLLRVAIDRDNGRKRGRSFIDFVNGHFAAVRPASLLVPP